MWCFTGPLLILSKNLEISEARSACAFTCIVKVLYIAPSCLLAPHCQIGIDSCCTSNTLGSSFAGILQIAKVIIKEH